MKPTVSDLTHILLGPYFRGHEPVFISDGSGSILPLGNVERRADGKVVIHPDGPGHRWQGVSYFTQWRDRIPEEDSVSIVTQQGDGDGREL